MLWRIATTHLKKKKAVKDPKDSRLGLGTSWVGEAESQYCKNASLQKSGKPKIKKNIQTHPGTSVIPFVQKT